MLERLAEISSLETIEPCVMPEKIAFAYTGQESLWAGMGMSLYCSKSIFHDSIDRCEQVTQDERKTSLIDRMFGTGGSSRNFEDPK